MNHTRLWIAAAIIALVLVTSFALSVPHTRDIGQTTPISDETPAVSSVALRDTFKKGTHTITGSIEAPNACTTITAQATVFGEASSTEGIRIDIAMPEDTGLCLQLPTETSFSVSIAAPTSLPVTAFVNGRETSVTGL